MTAVHLKPLDPRTRIFSPKDDYDSRCMSVDDIADRATWIQLLHRDDGRHIECFSAEEALADLGQMHASTLVAFINRASGHDSLGEVVAAQVAAGRDVFVYETLEGESHWAYYIVGAPW